LAFADVRTLDDHVAARLAGPRLIASLAVVAGLTGVALATLGIYSVLAHLVAARRRELAIRTAIGASPGQLAGHVLGIGGRIALGGVTLGLAASIVSARVTATQLHGVSAYDPEVYLATLAIVLLAVIAACLPPARAAGRVAPADVLRRQ
jgi:putative ABC transport system permease protein